MLAVSEGHKLNDVSFHKLSGGPRSKWLYISVKIFHLIKLCRADANDDDGHRQGGCAHNLINGLLLVSDYSVGQDEQDVVLLVTLRHLTILQSFNQLLDDRREVGRAIELANLECLAVRHLDALDAVAFRMERVAVQGELVPGGRQRRYVGSEAISGYGLVLVIVLQNASDTSQGSKILILISIVGVQRRRVMMLITV